MEIIVYIKNHHKDGQRLLTALEKMVPNKKIALTSHIEALSCRLVQPGIGSAVAVLMAANRQELFELISTRELFWNIRIILILPNQEKEEDAFALGCKLYPRYISSCDSDFSDVCAVLGKMLGIVPELERGKTI